MKHRLQITQENSEYDLMALCQSRYKVADLCGLNTKIKLGSFRYSAARYQYHILLRWHFDSVNGVGRINKVTPRRARLVLG